MTRSDLGEKIHIFSHIKHYMGIEQIRLSNPDDIPSTKTQKWMNMEDINAVGLTTGMKKILKLIPPVLKGRKRGLK